MEIKDPIIEKVVNKIIERSEVGIKKYNTTFLKNNKRTGQMIGGIFVKNE